MSGASNHLARTRLFLDTLEARVLLDASPVEPPLLPDGDDLPPQTPSGGDIMQMSSNSAPQIVGLSNATIAEGQLLSLPFDVQEPENQVVDYYVDYMVGGQAQGSLPGGARLVRDSSAGKEYFVWLPGSNDSGSYQFRFRAVDELGAEGSQTITVTVTDGGTAPGALISREVGWNQFEVVPSTLRFATQEETTEVTLRIDAVSPQGNPLAVSTTLSGASTGSAPGHWSNTNSRTFRWTFWASYGDAGSYSGTINLRDTVTDVTTSIPITVNVDADTTEGRDFVYAVSNLHDLDTSNDEFDKTWGVVSGQVPLDLSFKDTYGRRNEQPQIVGGTSLQYVLHTPTGTQVLSPALSGSYQFNWDTTQFADGSYVLGVQYLNGPNLNRLRQRLFQVVIDNDPGPVTGVQQVPIIGFHYDDDFPAPQTVDWVTFNGAREVPNSHPYPYQQVPSAADLPDPTVLVGDNSQWFVEPLVQGINSLYEDSPMFVSTVGGHIVSEGFLPQATNTSEDSLTAVIRHAYWCGGRGRASISPYSTFVPRLDGPGWYGIDIAGRLFSIDQFGNVVTHAGRVVLNHSIVPYDYRDSTASLSQLNAHQETLRGSFENGLEFDLTNDLAVDPRDPTILYVADAGNHRIAKVDLGTGLVDGAGNPLGVVTTHAGVPGQAGHRDGAGSQALLNDPYSLDVAADGTIYVADRMNNAIRAISPSGNVTTVVGGPNGPTAPTTSQMESSQSTRTQATQTKSFATSTINMPQVLRLDSNENLIIGEDWTRTIRRVNFSNQMVERIEYLPDNHHGTWIWLDVDTQGAAGPQDDIFVAISESLGIDARTGENLHNDIIWRIAPDGSRPTDYLVSPVWNAMLNSGAADQVLESVGHYPWGVAIDDAEARFLATGFGNSGVISVRMAMPGDPSGLEQGAFQRGFRIHLTGTVSGFAWGTRPAFSEVHGTRGVNFFGNVLTFDDMADMTDADLANFIRNGGSGNTPRPEVTGRDLADYIYFIRRTSLQGHVEEISLSQIESNLANAGLFDASDTRTAEIRNLQMTALDASTIEITWQTDEATIGVVAYDPNQAGYDYNFGLHSAVEPAYSKDHRVVLSHLEDGQDYTIVVRARDVQGNTTLTEPLSSLDAVAGVSSYVDWGSIDFDQHDNESVDANSGQYEFTASRTGILTVEALFSHSAGNVDVELYSAGGQLLDSSNTSTDNERVDVSVTAGQTYRLHLVGTNADVDVRLANLVTQNGSTVDVGGTSAVDTVVYTAGTTHNFTVNGAAYQFSGAGVSTINFNGGGGSDSLTLTGSSAADRAELRVGQADLTAPAYGIHGTGFENVVARTGGGADVGVLHDSAGNDLLVITPTEATLTGPGFSHRVEGFSRVYTVAGAGGTDTAQMYDSAGNDNFIGRDWASAFSGAGFYNEVQNFDRVYAYSTAGGTDTANLYDSAGNDSYIGRDWASALYGTGFYNEVQQFDRVYAHATAGGDDVAQLFDSAGNDRFIGRSTASVMFGTGFYNEARGFDRVVAFSNVGGSDIAQLYDSAGSDNLEGHHNVSLMTGTGFSNEVQNFERVYSYSDNGGTDIAHLYDTAGNDGYVGRDWASALYGAGYYLEVQRFDRVYTHATAGGTDTAYLYDSAGNDRFIGRDWASVLFGTGFYNEVQGFDRVYAYGNNGGTDTADLYDSAGNDSYIGRDWASALYGTGFYNEVQRFDRVYAHATAGGVDAAQLYDSAGNDTFVGRSYASALTGSGFYNEARGFESVVAMSTAGGIDYAYLYDSAGNDSFVGRDYAAAMSGTGFYNEARAFDRVYAYGSTGMDRAWLYDSSGDDRFIGRHWASALTGTGFYNEVQNFDDVYGFASGGGNDLAFLYDSPNDDWLWGLNNIARLASGGHSTWAYSFDNVTADGTLGGTNSSNMQAVDYVYNLLGSWQADNDAPSASLSVSGTLNTSLNSFDVNFDDVMAPTAFLPSSYSLVVDGGPRDGQVIAISSVEKIDADTARIHLAANLPNDTYQFTIAPAVTDLTGNAVTGTTVFSFTVQTDQTSPTAALSVSGTSTTSFSSFDVNFSEAMAASAFQSSSYSLVVDGGPRDGQVIAISSVQQTGSSTARINLAANLPNDTYQFTIAPTLTDLAGNALTGTRMFSFTVSEILQAYYVDAGNGNNSNSGTSPQQAWETISKVNSTALAAGDTVLFERGGSWNEELLLDRNGTSGNPITIGAYGSGADPIIYAMTIQGNYNTVENITVDHNKDSGDAIRIEGANDTLRNMEVRNGAYDGIDIGDASNVLIDGLLVHHFLAGSFSNQADAHGIVATGTSGITIRNTEVHHVSGDSFQADPDRDGTNDILIEDSEFWTSPLSANFNSWSAGERPGENAVDTKVDSGGGAGVERMRITIRNVTAHGWEADGYIANKAAFNMKEKVEAVFEGVTVYDSEIAFRLRGTRGNANVTLINAVVYDVDIAIRAEDDLSNLKIYNSTFGHGIGTQIQYAGGSGGTGSWELRNNAWVGQKPSVASHSSNVVASTSDFVNSGARDYHLASSSGLVDAGVTLGSITTDRDGNARPVGGVYDIGAYEWF